MDSTFDITLGDIVVSHAASYPLQVATVCGQRRQTYRELEQRTARLASALAQRGVSASEPVLWMGQNSDRLLELVLACARLGAIVCPANWRLSEDELLHILDDFGPRVVFWQREEIGATVEAARERSDSAVEAIWCCIDAEGDCEYEAFLKAGTVELPRVQVTGATPLMAIYTAAFSGKPRGALMTHQAIIHQGTLFGLLQEIDSDYIFLNSGPMFHIGNWMSTWPTFLFGGTNIFVRRVVAQELLEIIHRERCTGAYLVHSTQEEMVALNSDGTWDLACLKGFPGSPAWNAMTSSGTSLWHRRVGGYGQSETMGLITFTAFAAQMSGNHGRPSPLALVRIVDEEGEEVAPGEVGEILVRGPSVMAGYYRRHAEPEQRLLNGWHRTNDLGRREPDGSLVFIGPRQRMIKSGVENVYPAEVEQVIQRMDGVAQVAIIGVPDPKWIQTVAAVVVRAPGHAVSEADIVQHCRAHLASYKKPGKVLFVETLPRQASGMVDYDQLDADHGGGNYPGGSTRSR
ncbi:AMP-binding protein [Haliea salexigens]|jgi:long-chain acyl-CoA synthetase|uniref:AMP-binding protein n=1 Tax=Haliea salexigens TaxID=287487 RepID=UPI00040577FC|nr:AMP-binding protein [Haliea salexigens]|tara:strand:- start:22176 stop:23726 length:1551 start_codon:yes stop_codon:yes gene_type:complete